MLPRDVNSVLRDYQRAGITWLCEKWNARGPAQRVDGNGLSETASGPAIRVDRIPVETASGPAIRADTSVGPRALLLADDAGLGKTLQALETANRLDATTILVVCPAVARRVWADEIAKWFPAWAPHVLVVEPGVGAIEVKRRLAEGGRIIIITGYDLYSRATPIVELLRTGRRWSLMVIDEAHFLKTPTSKRTRAVYGRGSIAGVQNAADRVLLLSGTPTPNHAGELYPHIRAFWPGVLPGRGTQYEFEDKYTRYTDTQWGRQINGSRNTDELRGLLQPYVLRRRKAEVLTELPPLISQDAPLDDRNLKLTPEMIRLAERLRDAGDEAVMAALRVSDESLAGARHQLGLLKVGPSIEWINERLLSCRKILVFAWHRDVIGALTKGLVLAGYPSVTITGATPPGERALAIQEFQTNPKVRVFVGQIQAAGTAITLTEASEVAMVECSWVPGDNVQAIARAHRLGQRDSVLVSFLMFRDTLDSIVMQTFRRKAVEIADLQGDLT